MGYVAVDDMRVVAEPPDADAPIVYVVDSPEHPLALVGAAKDLAVTVVSVPVRNWNDALTPWPAAGLYRGEPDFGGEARRTLDELLDRAIPSFEAVAGLLPRRRAICGYSLGGLFSLYSFVRCETFGACACVSGSVWYEGWVDYLRGLDCDLLGRFAYLSVGTKEKRASRPLLKRVERNMEECVRILEGRGCKVRYVTGPGNHFAHVKERLGLGLAGLAEYLCGDAELRKSTREGS